MSDESSEEKSSEGEKSAIVEVELKGRHENRSLCEVPHKEVNPV